MAVAQLAVTAVVNKDEAGLVSILDTGGPGGTPLDPDDWLPGDTVYAIKDGYLWKRDDEDSTSPESSTCFHTADTMGSPLVRFKRIDTIGRGLLVKRVKSFTNTEPVEPVRGDEHGVGNAPEAWASGHAGAIALCEYGGPDPIWSFTPKAAIAMAFVEDVEIWRSVDVDSNWVDGLGNIYASGSIPPESLVVSRYNVQSIITTLPVSPTVGHYYLVSAAATGDLVAHQNKIAKCTATTPSAAFTYIAAKQSDAVYVQEVAQQKDYIWTGSTWNAQTVPVVVAHPPKVNTTYVGVLASITGSHTVAAASSSGSALGQVTHRVSKVGNMLEIRVRMRLSAASGLVLAGYFNNTLTSYDLFECGVDLSPQKMFYITPGDLNLNEFKFRAGGGTVVSGDISVTEIEPTAVSA